MKLSIMQPYFFPYLGYWQLIHCADTFVIYDDVNFIKGGWINRNRYLYQGEPKYFHIEMSGASPNKKINEVGLLKSSRYSPGEKLLSTFQMAYQKAPAYKEVLPVLRSIILHQEDNLAQYLEYSIRSLCEYLEIPTKILVSSQIKGKDSRLAKEKKVINICRHLGADTYINAAGGRQLYQTEEFRQAGLDLLFIEMNPVSYRQFQHPFVPSLSIVDVMMFNPKPAIQELLTQYTLTP